MAKDELVIKIFIRQYRKCPKQTQEKILGLLLDMEKEILMSRNDDSEVDYLLGHKLDGFSLRLRLWCKSPMDIDHISRLANLIRQEMNHETPI